MLALISKSIHQMLIIKYPASKLQGSSTQKTKDSAGRRLGVKKFHGEEVMPGDIIIRQRGTRYHPGRNTSLGNDHTITSLIAGKVEFTKNKWRKKKFYYINVEACQLANRKSRPPLPYMYHPQLFPQRAKMNYKADQKHSY